MGALGKTYSARTFLKKERGKRLPVPKKSCDSIYSKKPSVKGSPSCINGEKHFNGTKSNKRSTRTFPKMERGKRLPVPKKSCESIYSKKPSVKGSLSCINGEKHFNGTKSNKRSTRTFPKKERGKRLPVPKKSCESIYSEKQSAKGSTSCINGEKHFNVTKSIKRSARTLPKKGRGKLFPIPKMSCESIYSKKPSVKGSMSCINGEKRINGTKSNKRLYSFMPATSDVQQRVLSARRLRIKTFQNRLSEAQGTIEELTHENRCLRTLQKRQDSALAKFESHSAQLPKLLNAHAEELRVWQNKCRNLTIANKDLQSNLKQKEVVIRTLSDQINYYIGLNKNKNPEERQRLAKKVVELDKRLKEKDDEMKLLARHTLLENKKFRQELSKEQQLTKDLKLKLEKTRIALNGYDKLESLDDKFECIDIDMPKSRNVVKTKLEKDLEKILSQHDEDSDIKKDAPRTDITQPKCRFSKTSKNEQEPSRTGNTAESRDPTPSKNRIQLKGKVKACRNNTANAPEKQLQQQHPILQSNPKKLHQNKLLKDITLVPALTDCENDYENVDEDGDEELNSKNGLTFRLSRSTLKSSAGFESIVLEDPPTEGGEDKEMKQEVASRNYNMKDFDEKMMKSDEAQGVDDFDISEMIINLYKTPSGNKEDYKIIRKLITEDYKVREAYLDAVCRQHLAGTMVVEPPTKGNNLKKPARQLKNKLTC